MNKTKKCEYCGKSINIKSVICPLCGGHVQDDVVPASSVCPRCKVNLEVHIADGEEYDICPKCGGMWLDSSEFRLATGTGRIFKKDIARKAYHREPVKNAEGYIPCIRCGKPMNRKNFGRISGVIIDECSRHGVWLDKGELGKIQHFIADGGLEKYHEREIEKTRQELRDLATKVNQTAFSHRIIHFWNLKRWLFGG